MIHQPKVGGVAFAASLQRGPAGGTFRRRRPDPHAIDVEGVSWVCARVRPGKEFAVADDLAAVGYRVFAPHGVRVYRSARVQGTNSRRGVMERDYPVFGSYLFVGQGRGQWLSRDVHMHIGGVLENAGGSRNVPSAFISVAAVMWMRRRWDGRKQPLPFKVGDTVISNEGPFAGLPALVESLPTELRAVVSFPMFGRPTRVTVDSRSLEKV